VAKPNPKEEAIASEPKREEPRQALAQVRMLSGQTLVTGGWQTAPGRLTFVFVTPETTPAGTVVLRSSFYEVPEALWRELGLSEFRSESKTSKLNSVIGGPEANAFIAALKQTDGVKLLSSPIVGVIDGQSGSISVSGAKEGDLSVELLPKIVSAEEGLDLDVRAQFVPR
jgi:type II secretory pathway component GspD/PulD (secretin)